MDNVKLIMHDISFLILSPSDRNQKKRLFRLKIECIQKIYNITSVTSKTNATTN